MFTISSTSTENHIGNQAENNVRKSCFLPVKSLNSAHDKISSNEVVEIKRESDIFSLCMSTSSVYEILRNEVAFPSPRKYSGFDRVNRVLRYISSGIFVYMKKCLNVDPKEIQVGVVSDKIYISSNLHSDKLMEALSGLLEMKEKQCDALLSEKKSYKNHRSIRHINSLKRMLLQHHFNAFLMAGIREIENEISPLDKTNLTKQEQINQFRGAMNTLYVSLQKCIKSDFSGFYVSPSLHDEDGAVRHAERNIVSYLVENKNRIYSEAIQLHHLDSGKHIIFPLEGRFIPCAFCYEQESNDKNAGGMFDPEMKKFILHRSGKRTGKFYADETQYMYHLGFHENPVIANDRARSMLEKINAASEQLHCYGQDLVADSSFNTDSEQSDSQYDNEQ